MVLVFQGYCVLVLQASASAFPADSSAVVVHPISPETREKEWQQELSEISEIEKASLIFQINLRNTAPRIASQKAHGSATMDVLAIATESQWAEIEGVQLFLPTSGASTNQRLSAFSDWLQSLTPMQRKSFMERDFDFQELPAALQTSLLHLIGGWYPKIYRDVLNGIDNTRLQLVFGPQLVFQMHGTIYDLQTRKDEIEMKPILYNSEESRSLPPAQISKISVTKPVNDATPAKLDFGKGQILSLAKINAMAEQSYQKEFLLPQDIEKQLFFVSGQVTETAWAQALKEIIVAQTSSVTQREEKNEIGSANGLLATLLENEWKSKSEETFDLTWMRRQKVIQNLANTEISITTDRVSDGLLKLSQDFGIEESLPLSWFLSGRQTSLAELTKDRPGLAGYLESYRLQQNAPIRLQATVALIIDTPGAALTLPLL